MDVRTSRLTHAQLQHGILRSCEGRIEAHDLEDRSGDNTALGSYVVTFPDGERRADRQDA